MSARNRPIFFVVLVIAALVWAIFKSQNPGGASIPYFLTLLAMSLGSYYLGFVYKPHFPARYLSQAATFIFLLLAILMAYVFRLEDKAIDRIAEYIDVYPRISDVHLVPRVSKSELQHWIVKTPDPVSAVWQYYVEENRLGNWHVKTMKPIIVLEKNNLRLTISMSAQPREDITNIFYRLEKTE